MKLSISKFLNNNIIKGTFILSLFGFISRLLGFYYRIFITKEIGAEGMGLHQMIFPMVVLLSSISIAGIQTALSKFVSEMRALARHAECVKYLFCSVFISLSLSFILCFLLYSFSDFISIYYFKDLRCSLPLKIISFSLPLCSLHSCIYSFFLGYDNASVPGISVFVEQAAKVASVWLIFNLMLQDTSQSHSEYYIACVMAGSVVGELVCSIFCIICLTVLFKKKKLHYTLKHTDTMPLSYGDRTVAKKLVHMAFPISASRFLLSLLHSIEAILIPTLLCKYGLTYKSSIEIYGIVNGIALPFIFFPSTITNSASSMILPAISFANATKNIKKIQLLVTKTIQSCFSLGMFCTVFFLIFSDFIGKYIINNTMVSNYLKTLSWLCPFLYLGSAFESILNGLGLSKTVFIQGTATSFVRLCFIIILIPKMGIKAYLSGLLFSEIFHVSIQLYYIISIHKASPDIHNNSDN